MSIWGLPGRDRADGVTLLIQTSMFSKDFAKAPAATAAMPTSTATVKLTQATAHLLPRLKFGRANRHTRVTADFVGENALHR